MSGTILLVVAKAPEPGLAKTRLSPPATPDQAADVAAASLLDTLRAACDVPGAEVVVAWTGEWDHARRADELRAALAGVRLLPQRGASFGERLAAAYEDAARVLPGRPVLQIGMDTPQVTGPLLDAAARTLHRAGGPDAVLGLACDGGWWALGLTEPAHAAVLASVPTSRADTGARTLAALRAAGLVVGPLPELRDVDTMGDARAVAAEVPRSRFARAVAAVDRDTVLDSVFDGALTGAARWMYLDDGDRHELPATRWRQEPDVADELMLDRCRGATLDIGCGPGRLTDALRARGATALGIDVSPRAVRLTALRGGVAVQSDVFLDVPDQGRWEHALLADGNIGIGGDPRRLLRRVRQLLAPGGTAIVELAPPGTGVRRGTARIGGGAEFPWSWVGVDSVGQLAADTGFRLGWTAHRDARWFAELAVVGSTTA